MTWTVLKGPRIDKLCEKSFEWHGGHCLHNCALNLRLRAPNYGLFFLILIAFTMTFFFLIYIVYNIALYLSQISQRNEQWYFSHLIILISCKCASLLLQQLFLWHLIVQNYKTNCHIMNDRHLHNSYDNIWCLMS